LAVARRSSAKAYGENALALAILRKKRNNLRNMRKPSVLPSLFPQVRRNILAATLSRPEKWWYLSELAEFLGIRPSSLQREINSLAESEILEKRREGTRIYVRANLRSPIYNELRAIFEKTAGLIPVLRRALAAFRQKIAVSFVYGSIARGQERATSDVDVVVVGQAGLADLTPSLRQAERTLGREINVTHYSPKEFRDKVARRDHFLVSVLKKRKEFVQGGQRELDALLGK
jgi:predicted nucleotidyltransferase